jgi:hypothetical protein
LRQAWFKPLDRVISIPKETRHFAQFELANVQATALLSPDEACHPGCWPSRKHPHLLWSLGGLELRVSTLDDHGLTEDLFQTFRIKDVRRRRAATPTTGGAASVGVAARRLRTSLILKV